MTTKTQPDQWRMQDPPEAYEGMPEPQPVDELDIISQLPEGVY